MAPQLPHQPSGDPSEPRPVGGLLPHQGHPGHVRLPPGGHLRGGTALLPVVRPHHDKRLPEQRDLQPHRPEVSLKKNWNWKMRARLCYTHIIRLHAHVYTQAQPCKNILP